MKNILLTIFIGFSIPCLPQSVVTMDSSFGKNGFSILNLNPSAYEVQAGWSIMLNAADQKYLVWAYKIPFGAYIKYNRDGSLDTSFNKTGIYVVPKSEPFVAGFFIDESANFFNV